MRRFFYDIAMNVLGRVGLRGDDGISCLLGFLMVAWFATATAQPLLRDALERGRQAYDSGDAVAARGLWQPLADAGDARAQFAIGILHYEGAGVPKNLEQSAYWFELSARQGLRAAQYNLGNAYRYGYGVEQDDRKAIEWWQLAADQGLGIAAFSIGTQYYYGRGVEADQDAAFRWYQRAAELGYVDASMGSEAFSRAVPRAASGAGPVPNRPAPAADLTDGEPTGGESPISSAGLAGPAFIKSQAAEHYTMQLVAMSDESGLLRYLERLELPRSELLYFRFERNGQPFHALAFGVFATRADANAAVARLPEALRRGKPWIRALRDIQALL